MSACNCLGPRPGEPLCPCMMSAASSHFCSMFSNLTGVDITDCKTIIDAEKTVEVDIGKKLEVEPYRMI